MSPVETYRNNEDLLGAVRSVQNWRRPAGAPERCLYEKADIHATIRRISGVSAWLLNDSQSEKRRN